MNTHSNRRFSMAGSDLKLLAMICMAIDHFAATILYYGILLPAAPLQPDTAAWNWYQLYNGMRIVGRLAFPIFCFLLVEGFVHTSSRSRYVGRLFLFALLSELPFDLALFGKAVDWAHQNVFFTLLLGFLAIWAIEKALHWRRLQWTGWILAAGCGLLAWVMNTDYDFKGVLLIVILYVFRPYKLLQTIAGCLSLCWIPSELPACLAFLPIALYNGKRGSSLKYIFYLFYPVHLLLFAAVLAFL